MDRNPIVRADSFITWLAGGIAPAVVFPEDTERARAGGAIKGTAAALGSRRSAGGRLDPLLLCLSDRRVDSLPAVLPHPAFDFAGARPLLGDHARHLLDFLAHVEPVNQPRQVCGAIAGVADPQSSGRRDFLSDCVRGFQQCPALEPDGCACRSGYRGFGNRTGRAENS